MDKKYYKPDTEELHSGFDIEYISNKEWHKMEVTSGLIESLIYDIGVKKGDIINFGRDRGNIISDKEVEFRNKSIRVKYLDKEDIESLGWGNYVAPYEYNHEWSIGDYKMYVWLNGETPTIRVYHHYPSISFQGTIKNKSELKRLMKQLSIEI
tara:strand:+ start:94 stop:552 length:459 start_codon:yes stop_codon:yes gene_type:complete